MTDIAFHITDLAANSLRAGAEAVINLTAVIPQTL